MDADAGQAVSQHDGTRGEEYERLRRFVLGEAIEPGARPVGLAVLRRAGLRAWVEALEAVGQDRTLAAQCKGAEAEPPNAVDSLDAELARVITAMVLGAIATGAAT